VLRDQDGRSASVAVPHFSEPVDDDVKDDEVGPDGHGAGEGDFVAFGEGFDQASGVASDGVGRLGGRREESGPSGHFRNLAPGVEVGVVESQVEVHGFYATTNGI
jgi:hypothetical protein